MLLWVQLFLLPLISIWNTGIQWRCVPNLKTKQWVILFCSLSLVKCLWVAPPSITFKCVLSVCCAIQACVISMLCHSSVYYQYVVPFKRVSSVCCAIQVCIISMLCHSSVCHQYAVPFKCVLSVCCAIQACVISMLCHSSVYYQYVVHSSVCHQYVVP